MAFTMQQRRYPSKQVRLTLDSSYDALFNDLINLESIQSEPKDSSRIETRYSFNHDESAQTSNFGDDTCDMPSNGCLSDESLEDRLYTALQDYIEDGNVASSLPHLLTDEPNSSYRPAAGAQGTDHLSLASSFACCPSPRSSQIPFTTPLDTFLPSPPRSPLTPPLIPLADRFTTLTICKKIRSPTTCPASRVEKSPRKSSSSPKMAASVPYRHVQSAGWERRFAATAPEHLSIRGQTDIQYLSPPLSASYRTHNFPKPEYSDTDRVETPLPTGYGGHPNTPMESSFLDTRSTSSSSLDDFEAQYQTITSSHRTPVTAPMDLCISVPAIPVAQNFEADTSHVDGGSWILEHSVEAGSSIPPRRPIMPTSGTSAMGLGLSGVESEATNAGALPTEVHQAMQSVPLDHNNMFCLSQQTSRGAPASQLAPSNMLLPASLLRVGTTDRESPAYSASALSKSPILASPIPMPPPFNPNHRWSHPNLHVPTRAFQAQNSMTGHLPQERYSSIPQPKQRSRSPPQSQSGRLEASHHRRSKSSGSHMRRKSAGASSKSPRHASIGFVHFTPKDSEKLLTGVAPSGSSKTKARREREAAEKKRKFSEIAKIAVEKAGGDVNFLCENVPDL